MKKCNWLVLLIVLCILFLGGIKSSIAAPEVVVWAHQDSNTLAVAEETAQAFYVMAYTRGVKITANTRVELTVPPNWQIWQGSEAPPAQAPGSTSQTLTFPWNLRATKDTENSTDYSPANAAANVLLVARCSKSASKSTLRLRWLQDSQVIAQRDVTLKPVPLKWKFDKSLNDQMRTGMWLNDPHFNPQTMAEIYKGLYRSGINYVFITKAMFLQNQAILRQLGMKVFINQWWTFKDYMPDTPPAEAYSTMIDGFINKTRWSPTYMAQGKPAFISGIEKVVAELQQLDGISGFMLDYEPGRAGIEADYGTASREAFEKYLGRKVLSWPQDVLENGKDQDAWINFRNDQSEAYIGWFQKIMKERAPQLRLAVSTSGATGKPDDPNRRLAATDITQFSRVADSIHPQLYSWSFDLRSPSQLTRFRDKLELGRTTVAGAHSPVYPAVGSMYGNLHLSNPDYLRTQILYWWFYGADGFEIWQYFYGVDGDYLTLANEMTHLFQVAGKQPGGQPAEEIITAQSANKLCILNRKNADASAAWVGLFNLNATPAQVSIQPEAGWRLAPDEIKTFTIAPWTVHVVKCVQ